MSKELYKGKAKTIFETDNDTIYKVLFRDSVSANNGERVDEIAGKGELNNQISSLIFQFLENKGIKTHFVSQISSNEQLVQKVKIFPLEFIVRNISAGSFAKRYNFPEGKKFAKPIFEMSYKNDTLGDPLLNDDHSIALGLISLEELSQVRELSLKINKYLSELFHENRIVLVDFKLEFGVNDEGDILLADEFSPDNARLWDIETNQKLDKDNFRRDIGDLISAYEVVWERLSKYERSIGR